jgi:hypothetical protein
MIPVLTSLELRAWTDGGIEIGCLLLSATENSGLPLGRKLIS